MRLHYIGKDPESRSGQCPALYRTERTDRLTWVVQGWQLDAEAQGDLRDLAPNEGAIEVPEEVLELYVQQRGDR